MLADVARALNASVDLPALLAQALRKVAELLGLETGWVLLFDEATDEPYVAAAQNLPPGLAREPERMTGGCYCLDSFRAGDLSGAANVGVVSCSRLRALDLAHGETAGLRFHASVPLQLTVDDGPRRSIRRLGILNVASPEWRELDDDELGLLRTLGDVLSVAIERARLHGRRLEAAQTEERNRLAREIHDTLAQSLSGIIFRLEAADLDLSGGEASDPEAARESVTAALALAREALDEARRSVLDLRATPLAGRTLPEALTFLVAEMLEGQGAPAIEYQAPASTGDRLPPAVEIGLYRIAVEAIRNAVTHAGAERIVVRLDTEDEDLALTVEDDGRGFETREGASGEVAGRGRFGLVGMRERAKLLGGSLEVESTPGVGTRVTARVPVR